MINLDLEFNAILPLINIINYIFTAFYQNTTVIDDLYFFYNFLDQENNVIPHLMTFYLFHILLYFFFSRYNQTLYVKIITLFLSLHALTFAIYLYKNLDGLMLNYLFFYKLENFLGLQLNISYSVGVDSISFFFILLTVLIFPICLLSSWNSIFYNTKYYNLLIILIELILLQLFCATNLLIFYFLFECILLPMFLLISQWGSRNRRIFAAYQFLIYTLFGSLFLLIGLIFILLYYGSTDFHYLLTINMSPFREMFVWVLFFIGFAIKIPMFPVHLWLPEAHVEAPTAGSVLLAGILLKLGSYAFLKFLLMLFPFSSNYFSPIVITLSILGILFGSLTTLRQIDIKKVIAYSSIVHMNFTLLGLFSLTFTGITGSIILMMSHGLISAGLFLCVGVLYDRYHTRILKYFGGFNYFMPLFSFIFFCFTLGNISFPGTISFIGEFLILYGFFLKNSMLAIFTIFSLIFSTIYALWLYNRIFSGQFIRLKVLFNPNSIGIFFKNLNFTRLWTNYFIDISKREFMMFLPLIIFVIFFGLNPFFIINNHSSLLFLMFENILNLTF